MGYIAVFDIGTTAVKGILLNEAAEMFHERTIDVTTFTSDGGIVEQDPAEWWAAVRGIAEDWWQVGVVPEDVMAITFSGQMEDVIPIAESDAVHRAILYADTRATKEAAQLKELLPDMHSITGNNITATTPLAKIKWLQANAVAKSDDMAGFVFSSKDYIVYRLTDQLVTDPVTAATTGMMDLKRTCWSEEIIRRSGIDGEKLPRLIEIEAVVGNVTAGMSAETGFSTSTIVVNGSGDAGATTLGASAIQSGDAYFYMGTTGWMAAIQEGRSATVLSEGHFNLGFLDGQIISVAPLLNVGNVHKWAVDTYAAGEYGVFEELVARSEVCSNGLLFLPYLNGERNPIMDEQAKGAYWGIGVGTVAADLARSAMEGVAFSLRASLELLGLGNDDRVITLIGGGTKSNIWCQIICDVMNRPIRVPDDSEYLPSIGIAATAFIALGLTDDYTTFVQEYVKRVPSVMYEPDGGRVAQYGVGYEQFAKMYPVMSGMYK